MTSQIREGDLIARKYRVDRRLGGGGMGVVLAARHVELEQPVAIKLMHSELAQNLDAVARFIREGQAAVRLRSAHVARVLDVGRCESGAPYLVMEYLDGEDLAACIQRRGPLPLTLAVQYLLQACEAVAEAHSVGIVHRDLKPANLFLTKDAYGNDTIKVLDFGISKMSQDPLAAGDSRASATATSVVMGSPLFMPPEQMRSARCADARSDIWALGTILYELVTAQHAWFGETMSEVFVRVASDPAPIAREIRPELPSAVDAIIGRCLQKDPSQRFQSIVALAQPLAALVGPSVHTLLRGVIQLAGETGQSPLDRRHDRDASVDAASAPPGPFPSAAASAVSRSGGTGVGWGTQQTAPPDSTQRVSKLRIAVSVAVALLTSIAGGVWWQSTRSPSSALPRALTSTVRDLTSSQSVTVPVGDLRPEASSSASSVASGVIAPVVATSAVMPVVTAAATAQPFSLPMVSARVRANPLKKSHTPAPVPPTAPSNPAPTVTRGEDPTPVRATPDWGGRQ